MLVLKNISKTYPNSNRQIIDDLSYEINKGDSIAIVGPSGVGKSTLLNVISTLDEVDTGEVIYNGQNICQLKVNERADFRNKEIGFVFQQHHLLPQLNLVENVLVPVLGEKAKTLIETKQKLAFELVEKVGLSSLLHKKPGEMSVGECQRTAVVRALINSPNLLFADEPTGSLDEDSAKSLVDLLVKLNEENDLTIVMVTHSLELARKFKKVLKLERGKLIEL